MNSSAVRLAVEAILIRPFRFLPICRDDAIDAKQMAETIVFTQQSRVLHGENEASAVMNNKQIVSNLIANFTDCHGQLVLDRSQGLL